MAEKTILEKYLETTGETIKDIGPGMIAFGPEEMDTLMQQAIDNKQKVDFFYANDADITADKLSYRFISRN